MSDQKQKSEIESFYDEVLKSLDLESKPESVTIEILQLDSLFNMPRYQRDLRQGKVDRILAQFHPIAAGLLWVNMRPNGTPVLGDGGHRLPALQDKGFTRWPCLVTWSLDEEGEAKLWSFFNNNRSSPRPAERLKAAMYAKEPKAVELVSACNECGFRLEFQKRRKGNPVIQAVGALESAMKHGFLKPMLDIVYHAWFNGSPDPAPKEATEAPVLTGIVYVLREADENVDQKRLIKILRDRVNIAKLLSQADAQKGGNSTPLAKYVAGLIADKYNSRLSEDRRIKIKTIESLE